ncbi:hypothetical protein GCM10009798_22060 [Nocardioides panacihumi]|uniref:Glycosyltransferase RgtA/B/C/D-like domain-containing protein n=1 Tax=Nocardioides panacihumi TaxID=400774 RepID=A0ABN2R277_9ACTN
MLQRASAPSAFDRHVNTLTRRTVPFLLLVLTMCAVARKAATPLDNVDAYFHLRIGHEFVHGGWAPWHPGHLTSFEHERWLPTQWLSQVLMALDEDVFGLAGVAWAFGLLYVLFVWVLFWAARRQAALLPAAIIVPVAVIACWSNITTRPQVASFILVTVTVAVWQRARDRSSVPWLLIPTTWLWAMLHGMWPIGIAIGVAATIGIALDLRPPRAHVAKLLAVPVLSFVAAGLTPVGPRLYGAVLLVNSRAEFFGEWGPPDFRTRQAGMLLVLLGATTVALVRSTRTTWFDTMLLVGALGCSVYSQRTVPVAVAILVPLAASVAGDLMGDRTAPTRRERAVVLGVVGSLLVGLALAVPHTSADQLVQPAWVDSEIGGLPAGTPVLTGMTVGSYLLWKYPTLQPVVHGYADVYTLSELRARDGLETVKPRWDDFVRSTGATIALERTGTQTVYALQQAGWTMTHHNKNVAILVAPPGWLDASGHTS